MTPPTRAAIVAATRVAAPASGQPLEVVQPDDPDYPALVRAALQWKAAVLARDHDRLVALAAPGMRDQVAVALRDERSVIWRTLYDSRWSLAALAQRERAPTVIALRTRHLPGECCGVYLCYVDARHLPAIRARSRDWALDLLRGEEAFCNLMRRHDGAWRAQYLWGAAPAWSGD